MATTPTQEDTMACPSTPGHRCLDCAPQGRPFTAAGLHTGNPLQDRDPHPAPTGGDAKQVFDAHWQSVTTPRTNTVFDIDGANHDHFVIIPDPAKVKPAPKTPTRKRAASQARKALISQIPVILPKGA